MSWGVPKVGTIATVASGNLTLTEPAGIAEGDLMIACIAIRSVTGFANGDWTLLEEQLTGNVDASNGIASLQMWATRRGGSAPSLVFTRTSGNVGHGKIIAYSGAKGTTLADCRDVESSNTLGTEAVTATTGTITTAEDGELLVAMVAAGDELTISAFDAATDPATASGATDTTTAPTNGTWIERSDESTATGADTALGIADAVRATAGATGTVQATVSGTGARHAMAVAAFKAATTVTTPQSIVATAVGVAALTAATIYVRTLAPVAVGVPALTRLMTYSRTLAPTAIGVATLTTLSTYGRSLTAVAVGVPSLTKQMFVTLGATAVGVAEMSAGLLLQVAMAAVAVGVSVLTVLQVIGQTLAATAIGVAVVSTVTIVARAIAAIAVGVAGLVTQFIPGSGGGPVVGRYATRRHHRRR